MKIPLEWLNEYVNIKGIPSEEITNAFTSLGLLLDKPITNGVMDLEHRMDRSDWLSIIGCARDLAAYLKLDLKYPKLYKEKGREGGGVKIQVDCPDLVNRFNTRVFKNIKVAPSPKWLKERLESYGMPSINNVVDITNYVMIEFGQPLHAQDTDKMESPEIVIRLAKKGEKLTTLLGETVELDNETFVLTQNGRPTVIGGIVGGVTTAVDENTKNIVLDSGNYNQTNIRKTSRRLKIQNETVIRDDKFLHPQSTQIAIERATKLILDLAGGEYYENYDYYPKVTPLTKKQIRLARIKQVSGMDFDMPTVKRILTSLEYTVVKETKDSLTAEVPYFRTDVEVEDDLVADVLRIYGYSNIPTQKIDSAPPKEITPKIYNYEDRIRDLLINLGLHEHITDPLVKADGSKNQPILQNSLNSEKDALRTDIYTTLSPVMEIYEKHGLASAGLFEIGLTYTIEGSSEKYEGYKETNEVQTVFYDKSYTVIELSRKTRSVLSGLLVGLGINNVLHKKEEDGVKLYWNKNFIGTLNYNSFKLYIQKLLDIPESNLRVVGDIKNTSKEDLSLIVDVSREFGEVFNFIQNYEGVKQVEITEEYKDEKIGKDKKAILVKIEFEENTDVSKIKKTLITSLQDKFGIAVRK